MWSIMVVQLTQYNWSNLIVSLYHSAVLSTLKPKQWKQHFMSRSVQSFEWLLLLTVHQMSGRMWLCMLATYMFSIATTTHLKKKKSFSGKKHFLDSTVEMQHLQLKWRAGEGWIGGELKEETGIYLVWRRKDKRGSNCCFLLSQGGLKGG